MHQRGPRVGSMAHHVQNALKILGIEGREDHAGKIAVQADDRPGQGYEPHAGRSQGRAD